MKTCFVILIGTYTLSISYILCLSWRIILVTNLCKQLALCLAHKCSINESNYYYYLFINVTITN